MPFISTSPFRIKSYIRRDSRKTVAQEAARLALWPQFGLGIESGFLDFAEVFGRDAPTFLEIGFGTGQSLLALAKANPLINFIGVETHQPGIGALMQGIQNEELKNLKAYHFDVIDVLEKGIPNQSLAGVQIFFPDPWPKRRHHHRRLIQSPFIDLIISKLKPTASLHLATDWEDYAAHMMEVLSKEKQLINVAGENCYGSRSIFRPTVTKFEHRALRASRNIFDLQFQLI